MKNSFLLAVLLFTSLTFAQNKPQTNVVSKKVKYGLKLGLNISKLTDFNTGNSISSRTGLNIGGYLNYKFNNKLAFQPELLYTAQGVVEQGVSNGINLKLKYKLDYLAIPLMLKFYPNKNFNIEIGPQFSYNVKNELEAKGNGQTLNFDLDDFYADNGIDAKTNKFDLALNFGLGYELNNGINFAARYSYGLTKVLKGSEVTDLNGNSLNIKNAVITFGLGYTFK